MSRAPPLAGRYVREYRSSPGAAPRRGAGAGRGRPAAPERALGHRPRKRCHGAGARCARAPHASPGASTARAATAGGGGSGQAVATGACQPGRGTGEPGGAAGRACTGIIGGCGGFACSTPSPAARRAGTFAAIPRHGGCYTAAPWPATGVGAPLRSMLAALVHQVTAPAQQPQRVVAVQPWPAALVPVVEGAARGEGGLPGLPPLQTWLVRQGVVQTAEGERAFSLTLRVPVPWLQSQAQPAAASAPAPHTPSLAALFAGKPQALQSGTWALVLQSTEPAAGRTSALLALEFAPLAQAHVYGRELLQARQDPWLQMAVLQASGQAPKDEAARREREAGLCQTPGCPYAGRASCAQPFCVALRVVQPSGPVEPMPPL